MEGIRIYDHKGKEQGKLSLDIGLQKKKISAETYSCAIKVLRQNRRQGTVSCKGRSDVAFSGKKPWKQKGTGRARAGTASSPLWRKGGVIFGPQKRVKTLKISQKQKKYVFNNVFFGMQEAGNIFCIENGDRQVPSTAFARDLLKAFGLTGKKVIVFLEKDDYSNIASFRNLSDTAIIHFDQPNVFDLTNGVCWIFFQKDSDVFKRMIAKWN